MKLLDSSSSRIFIALAVCLSASSCLKTRAQLRENPPEQQQQPAGTPAQVQDVQPQGQYVIDELKTELTRLNGRIEDLERARRESADGAQTVNAPTQEAIKKLEARIVELEQTQTEVLTRLKQMQEAPAAKAAADPVGAFETGRKQFSQGNFDQAIENLSGYLKSPKGKHAEEATFLRAESYFALKQYKKALVDYSKFPEQFSKSRFMAGALYRIGQSFEALGMKEDAKGFYQELVDKFPKSPEAKRARSKVH